MTKENTSEPCTMTELPNTVAYRYEAASFIQSVIESGDLDYFKEIHNRLLSGDPFNQRRRENLEFLWFHTIRSYNEKGPISKNEKFLPFAEEVIEGMFKEYDQVRSKFEGCETSKIVEQLLPQQARQFLFDEAKRPSSNVEAALDYTKMVLERYKKSLHYIAGQWGFDISKSPVSSDLSNLTRDFLGWTSSQEFACFGNMIGEIFGEAGKKQVADFVKKTIVDEETAFVKKTREEHKALKKRVGYFNDILTSLGGNEISSEKQARKIPSAQSKQGKTSASKHRTVKKVK